MEKHVFRYSQENKYLAGALQLFVLYFPVLFRQLESFLSGWKPSTFFLFIRELNEMLQYLFLNNQYDFLAWRFSQSMPLYPVAAEC